MQINLFAPEETPVPPKPDVHAGTDMESLRGLAFLYTATESGNNSGIRFMMSIEDAQKWCDLEISKGVLHGTQWAYFFTSVANFVTCYWVSGEPVVDLQGAADDGSWDERIAAQGLKKISLWDFREVLEPLGIKVANAPSEPISTLTSSRGIKQTA